jgi:hypothetical protein
MLQAATKHYCRLNFPKPICLQQIFLVQLKNPNKKCNACIRGRPRVLYNNVLKVDFLVTKQKEVV